MGPLLDSLDLRLVALSRDDVEQAQRMHTRDALGPLTLLADPELKVIRQFGLEHHKALAFGPDVMRLFGLPVGLPKGFEAMAIPTTMLIDEDGIVRWIDQAADYRIRSDAARVEAAVREHFGPG